MFVHHYDVSVILAFGDDEEVVGSCVAGIAESLRQQELSFEVIAVDDDSGDNSVALLSLVRADYPELNLLRSDQPGHGSLMGLKHARGRIIWLLDAASAGQVSLAALDRAYRRVARGERDLVVVGEQCMVARRMACMAALAGTRRPTSRRMRRRFGRDLTRRARRHGLRVDGPTPSRRQRWATQLLTAFSVDRIAP